MVFSTLGIVRDRVLLGAVVCLALAPPAGAQGPSKVGRWEAPRRWPVPAIHSILLPTGEILNYSYADYFVEHPGSQGVVWNPRKDRFRAGFSKTEDFFCSGQSVLPDGRVLVTGGWVQGYDCTVEGPAETFLFDPARGEWSDGPTMRRGRYYPTHVTLGDGRVLILGGDDASCQRNPEVEIFDPADGSLSRLRGADRAVLLYPRAHLLSNGQVAHVGPEDQTYLLDLEAGEWRAVTRTRRRKPRFEGTSFLVPGSRDEVMICGGFSSKDNVDPTASCERIDFRKSAPTWHETRPMRFARAHANAVLLPDGTVFVVGGGGHDLYDEPVRQPELYDPKTDVWQTVPAQHYSRMYHSTAILLPDGRVLSAGQDDDHYGRTGSAAWAEIYRPPYLFRGPRPAIRRAPPSAALGGRIQIKAKQAGKIERVVLMRPGAVTHSVNMEQRYQELDLEHLGGKKLAVEIPANANLVPIGHYLLFLVNERGAVSEGRFLRLLPAERGASGRRRASTG